MKVIVSALLVFENLCNVQTYLHKTGFCNIDIKDRLLPLVQYSSNEVLLVLGGRRDPDSCLCFV